MADTGWVSAGTGTNSNATGTEAWLNPGKITALDSDYSVVGGSTDGDWYSNYLKATNFGFNIPTGATIDGIEVRYHRRESSGIGTIEDSEIKIIKADGTIGTTNKSTGATWNSGSTYTADFGGSSDTWGETWTAEEINDSDFGSAISVYATPSGFSFATANIDLVQIKVYYTIPETAPTVVLNTPDEHVFSTPTPQLEFTGTDDDDDDITYQLQIDDTDDTFGSIVVDALSDTDPGFENLDTPADEDPFNSEDKIGYTVQSGGELPNGIYYWRVRGKDPDGTDEWGEWSEVREFSIASLQESSITVDGLILATETKTFTVDALLKGLLDKEITFDALLAEKTTQTFNFDGLIAERTIKELFFDGVLVERLTETFTFDSYISGKEEQAFTFDSYISGKEEQAFTLDAYLKAVDYYVLDDLILPRPKHFRRGFVVTKTDVLTLGGRTGRDIIARKEKFILGWEYLSKTEIDDILSKVDLNTPLNFRVYDRDLVIRDRLVIPYVASVSYDIPGSSYIGRLQLELIAEG